MKLATLGLLNINVKFVMLNITAVVYVQMIHQSRIQRVEFAFIIDMILNCQKKKTTREIIPLETPLPKTDADIRNRYVVGSESIVKNLPRPSISIIGNHSYASVRQCIAHFLVSGKVAFPIDLSHKAIRFRITDFHQLQ